MKTHKFKTTSLISMIQFNLILLLSLCSQAQEKLSPFVLKNMNQASFAIVYVNDCNQLLLKNPCQSNDTWYTLGIKLETDFRLPRQKAFVQFQASSELYTEKIADKDPNDPFSMKKEIFTEINQLGFKVRPLNPKNTFFPSFGISAGVINRDHALKYMALAIQSGLDGRGGYHKAVGQDPKINVSRGDFVKYMTLSPQINKIVIFYDSERKPIWMNFSLWADISTYQPMTTLNHSMEISIPVISPNNLLGAELDFKGGETTQFHSTGVGFTPQATISGGLFNRFKIEATSKFPVGAPNNFDLTQVKYDEKLEPLMNIKIKWKFNNPKR